MFNNVVKTNMELEIYEQKNILPNILNKYFNNDTENIDIELPKNVKKIIIVASGSSYHCARFAIDLVEKISRIETRAIYSSEFLLKSVIPQDKNTLYIFITQSGETSDTLKAIERVKKETNLQTLCITNVENSTIWNECDYKVACHAGVETGIAATKSFTSQMLTLILISLKLIDATDTKEIVNKLKKSLFTLGSVIDITLQKRNEIKKIAKLLVKEKVVVITADGISYAIAKEGVLKIKETSYKNISEAILGEFMHGHVAVLNNKSSLIYISVDNILDRSVNNLNKIKKEYNPRIILIGKKDYRIHSDFYVGIDCENELQQLFSNVIILQLLALEIALILKRNVDNPKGLNKVVIES